MSGEAFTDGIEEHQIEGVTVRVFNIAKLSWIASNFVIKWVRMLLLKL
jgi:hypothetical protein